MIDKSREKNEPYKGRHLHCFSKESSRIIFMIGENRKLLFKLKKELTEVKLIVVGLLIVYGVGAWKFWTGFNRTDFSSRRLSFTLLWPAFLVGSQSYRRNFTKAIKGSR